MHNFFADCTGWPSEYQDALRYIRDEGQAIDRDEFLKLVNWSSFSGGSPDKVIPESDWAINYLITENIPYFIHSGIEHVFASEDEIKAIQDTLDED